VRTEIEDIIGIPRPTARRSPPKRARHRVRPQAVVRDIPAPKGRRRPLKALIFDSYYDSYLGVVVYIRVFDGTSRRDAIKLMNTGSAFEVVDVGYLDPFGLKRRTGCRRARSATSPRPSKTSRTLRWATPSPTPAPRRGSCVGFKEIQPMVYAGIYPSDARNTATCATRSKSCALTTLARFRAGNLHRARLRLPRGFLGLSIWNNRGAARKEFNSTSSRRAVGHLRDQEKNGNCKNRQPDNFRLRDEIEIAYEPIVRRTSSRLRVCGKPYELCQDRRGVFIDMKYNDTDRWSCTTAAAQRDNL
jgi:GTP-binding protein LepA